MQVDGAGCEWVWNGRTGDMAIFVSATIVVAIGGLCFLCFRLGWAAPVDLTERCFSAGMVLSGLRGDAAGLNPVIGSGKIMTCVCFRDNDDLAIVPRSARGP